MSLCYYVRWWDWEYEGEEDDGFIPSNAPGHRISLMIPGPPGTGDAIDVWKKDEVLYQGSDVKYYRMNPTNVLDATSSHNKIDIDGEKPVIHDKVTWIQSRCVPESYNGNPAVVKNMTNCTVTSSRGSYYHKYCREVSQGIYATVVCNRQSANRFFCSLSRIDGWVLYNGTWRSEYTTSVGYTIDHCKTLGEAQSHIGECFGVAMTFWNAQTGHRYTQNWKPLVGVKYLDTGVTYNALEVEKIDNQPPPGLEQSLCSEALSTFSFDSNMIANISDLIGGALGIVQKMKQGKFPSPKSIRKMTEDAWMSYRYVYSTTLSDVEELSAYIPERNTIHTVRAGDGSVDGTMHVKIALDTSRYYTNLFNELSKMGLAPDLYNAWDMVPFSFVVDWLLPIGDFLEQLTQYGRSQAYNIRYITTSWKWTKRFKDMPGEPEFSHYGRTVSDVLPPFIPYIEQRASGKTILKRAIDTVCLIDS